MKQAVKNENSVLPQAVRRSFRWLDWLARLGRWHVERQVYRQLSAMDDWQLRDIGISRSDIRAVAAGVFERRC